MYTGKVVKISINEKTDSAQYDDTFTSGTVRANGKREQLLA
jgi:hypothetical protein